MKAEQKSVGTKAKIRIEKEKQRRTVSVLFLLVVILLLIGVLAYISYRSPNVFPGDQTGLVKPDLQFKPENPNPELGAAIVDQLSLTCPNQTFIEKAASILTKSGYTVDYFRGEKVTVEFYRDLPLYGYGLIIFRVHSSAAMFQSGGIVETAVSFFTSEDYSETRYLQEQLTDQLLMGSYSWPEPPHYFGITPKFVTTSMKGMFRNSTIVMMGCEGLNNTKMAEAFIAKEARVCIGWTNLVSVGFTDQATVRLLQHLIAEKQTVGQAIDDTIKDTGPDLTYDSHMTYYPR